MRGKPRFVTRVTALRQYVLSEQAELKADGFCHAADVPRRIPHESVFDFVDVGDHAHDSLGVGPQDVAHPAAGRSHRHIDADQPGAVGTELLLTGGR
jgi:hypothetical protein